MNVSFPKKLMDTENYNYKYQLKKVTETESGKKNVASNRITQETGADKDENDRLLRKVQFSQTKAEVLGHYLGAMQNAVRESGSNGIIMYRRVGNMMGTEKAFEETDQYKKKKDTDTFLIDQMKVLEKRQEEIRELKEAQEKSQENTYGPDQDSKKSVTEETSGNNTTATQQNRNTSSVQNTDLQQKAAKMYKSKDAPERNPSVQEVFNGMI